MTLSDVKEIFLPRATLLNGDPDRIDKWVYRPFIGDSGRHVLVTEVDDLPLIIKYGTMVFSTEVETMQYVSRHTSIRIPTVYAVFTKGDVTYIIEEHLPGSTLQDALPYLNSHSRAIIGRELKDAIADLARLSPQRTTLGPLHGSWQEIHYFFPFLTDYPCAPGELCTTKAFLEYFMNIRGYRPPSAPTTEERLRPFDLDRPPVFSHGDLVPCNIMVNDGHVVGIIDWAEAGWYPYFWNDYMLEQQGYDQWKGVELWKEMIQTICEHFPDEIFAFRRAYSWASYLY